LEKVNKSKALKYNKIKLNKKGMVGKTSLITRYITGQFDEKNEKRTIEAYFKEKTIKINQNSFNLNIWVKKNLYFI
jgi:hypothetical protein